MDRASVARKSVDFADLPLSVVLRINALADDFEVAWLSGHEPNVTDFENLLGTSSAAARSMLREHLTQLQVELSSSHKASRNRTHDVGKKVVDWRRFNNGVSDEPSVLGEYQILECLGIGGMGVVYKALHRRLERFVAIKIPRFATQLDPVATARFVREARLLGRLTHPHLVPALDAGDSDYGPYLVTEFIEGETIEALVRRTGPVSLESAMSLTAQAASALGYAHAHGIIHRDVKPSNLFLGTDRRLRVLDFGLAKMHFEDRSYSEAQQQTNATQTGAFIGTVSYAAPEQLVGTDRVDHRADVYSLGCAFYFMLTGEPLHTGSLSDRLLASHKEIGTSLRRRRPETPRSVEIAWQRMVANNPARRIASMAKIEATMGLMPATISKPDDHLPRILRSLPRRTSWRLALATMAAFAIAAATFAPAVRHGQPATLRPPAAVAPFNALEAQRHQQRWADHLSTNVRSTNSIGMPLVLIPPGEYVMGRSDDPVPELPSAGPHRLRGDPATQRPQHRVVLRKPFYMGETEVTVGQFRRFVEASGYLTEAERRTGWGMENGQWVERTGYSWKNLGQWSTGDDYPVNNVTWNDACAFCDWLTSRADAGLYRLPTEAEWEFACRAGSTTTFYFGTDPDELTDHAWIQANSSGVYWPVALKKTNPFGLYDMYGNRREWCLDSYSADFYAISPVHDPVNDTASLDRVMRGGAYANPAAFATSAHRWMQSCSITNHSGFRVVLEVQ